MGTSKRQRQKQNRQQVVEARARSVQRRRTRSRGIRIAIVAAIIIGMVGVVFVSGGSDSSPTADSATTIVDPAQTSETREFVYGDGECPPADGSAEQRREFAAAPQLCIDPAKTYTATFDTSEGTVVVELDTKKTPNTVNNFVVLSRYKYYDGSYIFRTDPSLDIIQGGGQDNTDGPGYVIEDEGNQFTYSEGDLVMARSSGPNSGGGQFFFVTGPKASVLDYREGDPASQGTYVTFGKVKEGLDVTKSILALSEGEGSLGGAPSRPVQIRTVTITES